MATKAQSTVIGFLAITAISIVIAGTTFLWAKPLFERATNQDEVLRIENRFLETHAAIKRVANQQSQAVVDFPINIGRLFLDDTNDSIIFKSLMDLPIVYDNLLFGNDTYELGQMGTDEPAYLQEQGTYQAKLHYRVLNDSGTCYKIALQPRDQVAAGPGDHKIFLKWVAENRSANLVAGCVTNITQIIEFEID